MPSALQSRLVVAVQRAGVSTRELAERSGYSQQHVQRLVYGKATGTLEAWSCLLEAAGVEITCWPTDLERP